MSELFDRYASWGFPQKPNIDLKNALRVNTLRISSEELQKRLKEQRVELEKVPFLTNGFYYSSPFPISSTLEHLLGYFYIQESSAQLVGEIVAKLLTKNSRVLDMCAAPGGKTTHISELMQNKGTVVAIEKFPERAKKLLFNLERMHVENVNAFVADALTCTKEKIGTFDVIVIDAPCSANYMSERDWIAKRKIVDFENRAKIQKALLAHALTLLNPGGYIVYSTCSLEKEEDEEVVETVLDKMKVLPAGIKTGSFGLTSATKNCVRLWPTQHQQPGFFIAVLTPS